MFLQYIFSMINDLLMSHDIDKVRFNQQLYFVTLLLTIFDSFLQLIGLLFLETTLSCSLN